MFSTRHLSRRTLLAFSAASVAGCGTSHAQAQDSKLPKGTPQADPGATPISGSGSTLVIGQETGSLDMVSNLHFFDQSLASTGMVSMPDSAITLFPTPNPNFPMVSTLSTLTHLDIARQTIEPIAVDGEMVDLLYPPSPLSQGTRSFGGKWFVVNNFGLDQVLLVDSETGESQDITGYVVPADQGFAPAAATFSRSGEAIALWTGNFVWFVDVHAPEDSYPLDGGMAGMFSTTSDISADDQWLSYTVYDSNTPNAAGHVILQRADDKEPIIVADGTAWSAAEFLPGLPESFLLMNEGVVELRSLADPAKPGAQLGTIEAQPHFVRPITADGMRQVIGSRADDESTLTWQLLDVAAGTMTPLDDLTDLAPMRLSTWQQAQTHVAFAPAAGFDQHRDPGDIVGLDFLTGETYPLLRDVVLPSADAHSTSTDGAKMVVTSANRGKHKGAWIIDLADRTVLDLPYGDNRQYTEAAFISPDGADVAASIVQRPGDRTAAIAFDSATAEATEILADGLVLGWT